MSNGNQREIELKMSEYVSLLARTVQLIRTVSDEEYEPFMAARNSVRRYVYSLNAQHPLDEPTQARELLSQMLHV
jgi:chorismate-pyruvate lyase